MQQKYIASNHRTVRRVLCSNQRMKLKQGFLKKSFEIKSLNVEMMSCEIRRGKFILHLELTNRRLKTRINEHKTNENSALFRHSFLTDHVINYSNPKILARDNNSLRLQIKETLKIKEHCAHKSLNGNLGSFKLSLW